MESEWEVVPGGEDARDKAAADFLRDNLNAIQFDQASRKMHGTVLYGYGVAECLWGRDGNSVYLADHQGARALAIRFRQGRTTQTHSANRISPHAAAQILADHLGR